MGSLRIDRSLRLLDTACSLNEEDFVLAARRLLDLEKLSDCDLLGFLNILGRVGRSVVQSKALVEMQADGDNHLTTSSEVVVEIAAWIREGRMNEENEGTGWEGRQVYIYTHIYRCVSQKNKKRAGCWETRLPNNHFTPKPRENR